MISMYYFLWARYVDYAKKYQLAVDDIDDFNSKVDEVQREAVSILAPYYQSNEKVRSLLKPWVLQSTGTSDINGVLTLPTDAGEEGVEFYRVLSIGAVDGSGNFLFPVSLTQENEIILITNVPQRSPNVAKKRAYYLYNAQDTLQLYPKQAIPYILFYLIYPFPALLQFTQDYVDGEFVQYYDPDGTIDLLWDKDASNLLLYMLLEKYGISSRDDLLAEFGKLGISMTLQPQE